MSSSESRFFASNSAEQRKGGAIEHRGSGADREGEHS
ncbi:hypothetical protein EEB11_06200 [Pseudotabrizicola sediminis]|uniref:Stress-induced protein n=1 Tax=Pseudotabrizicola sediminis TaxID=2486418 RepID=A0ABY2KNU8_9RHOB|nr:hypothetical protein EEB11_06200 [Pseudotabrizicola sediminis]